MGEAKPFDISKRDVWDAFKRVKANRGAAGVDRQTIADFEADLSNNLYKLRKRLSSGSYFPSPVRRVDIAKGDGVGMVSSQYSGMVICCDGTEAAAKRIGRVLWNDPATGVMRHADAGYDEAIECARENGLNLPAFGIWGK